MKLLLGTLTTALVFSTVQAQPMLRQPMFIVHSANQEPVQGRVTNLGAGWSVKLAENNVEVPAGDLISLRRVSRPLPPWPMDTMLILANQDRIRGTVTGGNNQSIQFQPRFSSVEKPTSWAVPLTSILAAWIILPAADLPDDPTQYPWALSPKRRDAILLNNHDVLQGNVEGFSSEPAAVRLKSTADPGMNVIALSRIRAIAFDPSLARVRRPKGAYARVVLADGSRISLASATVENDLFHGTTLVGTEVVVPLSEILALDIFQGKAVYLSDLKPKKVVYESFNGVTWDWRADRNAKGLALQLGTSTFDKGLGTHSHTVLTYDLSGKYRRFEAVLGLDSQTGRKGNVDVRVIVDGQETKMDGLVGLSGGNPPRAIRVNVTGARELTLIVGLGANGDVQDDVNWCDARLIP